MVVEKQRPFFHTVTDLSAVVKLVGELVDKWSSFPESQHTPLCTHLLGLAMKIVSQLALGETFSQDTQVIAFRKNHDTVSREPAKTIVELVFLKVLLLMVVLLQIWSEIGKGFLDGSLEKSSSRNKLYQKGVRG